MTYDITSITNNVNKQYIQCTFFITVKTQLPEAYTYCTYYWHYKKQCEWVHYNAACIPTNTNTVNSHLPEAYKQHTLPELYAMFMSTVVVVASSSLARILGECLTMYSPPVPFFFFFFKVEISSFTLIPLLRPGSVHSGSASWHNCGRVFPDVLRVSLFPDRFPHYAWTAA